MTSLDPGPVLHARDHHFHDDSYLSSVGPDPVARSSHPPTAPATVTPVHKSLIDSSDTHVSPSFVTSEPTPPKLSSPSVSLTPHANSLLGKPPSPPPTNNSLPRSTSPEAVPTRRPVSPRKSTRSKPVPRSSHARPSSSIKSVPSRPPKTFGAPKCKSNLANDPRRPTDAYCRDHDLRTSKFRSINKYRLSDKEASIPPSPFFYVVVSGYDPLKTSDLTLHRHFEAHGKVAHVHVQRSDQGAPLNPGICLVRYKDDVQTGKIVKKAADAAKEAASVPADSLRIGATRIKLQLARDETTCKHIVQHMLDKQRDRHKARVKPATERVAAPPVKPKVDTSRALHHASRTVLRSAVPLSPAPISAAPSNAPTGPSCRAPQQSTRSTPITPRTSLQATASLRSPDRRPASDGPRISISKSEIEARSFIKLKDILPGHRNIKFREDDRYYDLIFENSPRGQLDARICLDKYDRRSWEGRIVRMFHNLPQVSPKHASRSPLQPNEVARRSISSSPIRVIKQGSEDEDDLELVRKRRAEDLDPVIEVIDKIKSDACGKLLIDIKTKIILPQLERSLASPRHDSKRRKICVDEPPKINSIESVVMLSKIHPVVSAPGRARRPVMKRRQLRTYDHNPQRVSQTSRNAYDDDDRRRHHKKTPVRKGPNRLQDTLQEEPESDHEMESDHDVAHEPEVQSDRDAESEDDVQIPFAPTRSGRANRVESSASRTATPVAMDTSEAPETSLDTPPSDTIVVEPTQSVHPLKEAPEKIAPHHKRLLGDLASKRPERMAMRELEQVIAVLPPTSAFATRAREEIFSRNDQTRDSSFVVEDAGDIGRTADADAMDLDVRKPAHADKKKGKTKRKTKKELARERTQRLLAETENDTSEINTPIDIATPIELHDETMEDLVDPVVESPFKVEVEWGVSTDQPRRTVEDENDIVLDIDGWQHLVKDDEDFELLSRALEHEREAELQDAKLWAWSQKQIKALNTTESDGAINVEVGIPGYYVAHESGCARTEGVKKILNSEKSMYLPHRIKVQKAREAREALAADDDQAMAAEAAKSAAASKAASSSSSRSNRANNRRLVNDINLQKQYTPASGADTDAFRFNQLKKRKKHVRFDRSAIHGWGLYSEENIVAGDLIIEYVGEKLRQKVADMREIRYDKQGVGSSYLFRMAEDEIIDATKKGGIARFINHSCVPNCTAKIIKVEGTRRIVIYALKDIAKYEELTYDYKFDRELDATDRIPCLCGSVGCKKFLN